MNTVLYFNDYDHEELKEKANYKKSVLYKTEIQNFKRKQQLKQEAREHNKKVLRNLNPKAKSETNSQIKTIPATSTVVVQDYLNKHEIFSKAFNGLFYIKNTIVRDGLLLNTSVFGCDDLADEELVYFLFSLPENRPFRLEYNVEIWYSIVKERMFKFVKKG